jgi:hypothetical protein
MNRRLPAVLAALSVLAAAPALQGCAADEVASVDVAKAAQATAAKRTARLTGLVSASGFGLPGAMQLRLDGVTSLVEPALDVRTDVGPAIRQVQPLLSSLPLELRLRDGVVFVKIPAIARAVVPGDADWASLDLRKLVRSAGGDPSVLGAMSKVDTASVLRMLRSAGTLKPVGTETIDGTKTTHLRGTIRLADQLKLLPAKVRAAAQRALARMKARGHAKLAQPVDVWVDGDDLVRREQVAVAVPAHEGVPAGRLRVRLDFSDFGAPLAGDTPAVADTFDATAMATRFGLRHHRR